MNYKIIGKYIKNLNFTIPNAKTFFLLTKDISNYKVNIDIKSTQIKDKIIEVETSLNLLPINENFEKIDTNIILSTVVELMNNISDKEEIEKTVLIDVPSQIYPDIRKIFIFLFENSGFKNIKISEKVNFQELYENRKSQK